jgi:hypothetical protein
VLVKALETKSIRGTQKHDTQKTKYTGDKNTQGCLTSTAPQLVVVSQLVHEWLNTPGFLAHEATKKTRIDGGSAHK